MAEKRKAISTKTRFEIFKRDGFVCQYCGSHPPQVVLHVDHILAVAKGGTSEMDNLVTACDLCNMGKGARDLSVCPQSLKEKAALLSEKEGQLLGYQQLLEAKRERLESEIWNIGRALYLVQKNRMDHEYFQSIKRFIERLGVHEVMDAAEIALAKKIRYNQYRFKYFCGVCWGKIRDGDSR